MEFSQPTKHSQPSTGVTNSGSDLADERRETEINIRKNSKLTQNEQFKKDLSKYEINYHLDSVFKYRPEE